MRNYLAFICMFLGCMFLAGFSDEQIPNLTQPRPDVFTSGQPTETGFQEIAAMGIKTVINVLPEAQCLKGEANTVRSNHMVYKSFPFETATLTRDMVDDFGYVMMTAEQPILIHCSTGNHVGGLWLAYRVVVDHAPLSLALREARRIGIKPGMEQSVLRWLGEEVSATSTAAR